MPVRFDYVDPVTGQVTSYKSITAARNVNDNLKWETTTMVNLGLDFAFLNGRINGTVEWYNKSTKDMIWDYPVSAALYPVSTLTANVGKMRNIGIELTINAVPVQTHDFRWTTSLNLSHNDNEVVSVSNSEFNMRRAQPLRPARFPAFHKAATHSASSRASLSDLSTSGTGPDTMKTASPHFTATTERATI